MLNPLKGFDVHPDIQIKILHMKPVGTKIEINYCSYNLTYRHSHCYIVSKINNQYFKKGQKLTYYDSYVESTEVNSRIFIHLK